MMKGTLTSRQGKMDLSISSCNLIAVSNLDPLVLSSLKSNHCQLVETWGWLLMKYVYEEHHQKAPEEKMKKATHGQFEVGYARG